MHVLNLVIIYIIFSTIVKKKLCLCTSTTLLPSCFNIRLNHFFLPYLLQNPKELEGCDGIHCDSNDKTGDRLDTAAGIGAGGATSSVVVGPISASATNLLARTAAGQDSMSLPLQQQQQQQQQQHSHSCPSSPTETDCSSGFSTLRRRSVTLTEKVRRREKKGCWCGLDPTQKCPDPGLTRSSPTLPETETARA